MLVVGPEKYVSSVDAILKRLEVSTVETRGAQTAVLPDAPSAIVLKATDPQ